MLKPGHIYSTIVSGHLRLCGYKEGIATHYLLSKYSKIVSTIFEYEE